MSEHGDASGEQARGGKLPLRGIAVALLVLLALLALDRWRASSGRLLDEEDVIRAARPLMGTIFSVEVFPGGRERAEAQRAAFAALDLAERLEERISEWIEGSETSALNRAAGGAPLALSAELLELITASLDWARRTNGAFDVTGGPLYELWERAREDGRVPGADEVRALLDLTGFSKVRVAGNSVRLERPGMKLGFGAIGKGFAADRMAAFLRSAGWRDFIVDAGGNLVLSGARGARPWNIAVRHPRQDGPFATCRATDCAVATSGDYERFFEVDGVRYSHVIDPRTGWPVRGLSGVTVFASSGTDADALSTALFVMGMDQGLAFAESQEGVEALFIGDDGAARLTSGLRLEDGGILLLSPLRAAPPEAGRPR
ncbi:MAG: FAD:protein FMN transferase [Planctomycetes bacterium]|nr:FAD:protein FMN transferase [Planctomycetota bacterium]